MLIKLSSHIYIRLYVRDTFNKFQQLLLLLTSFSFTFIEKVFIVLFRLLKLLLSKKQPRPLLMLLD